MVDSNDVLTQISRELREKYHDAEVYLQLRIVVITDSYQLELLIESRQQVSPTEWLKWRTLIRVDCRNISFQKVSNRALKRLSLLISNGLCLVNPRPHSQPLPSRSKNGFAMTQIRS